MTPSLLIPLSSCSSKFHSQFVRVDVCSLSVFFLCTTVNIYFLGLWAAGPQFNSVRCGRDWSGPWPHICTSQQALSLVSLQSEQFFGKPCVQATTALAAGPERGLPTASRQLGLVPSVLVSSFGFSSLWDSSLSLCSLERLSLKYALCGETS
jgi:hypothetical protein